MSAVDELYLENLDEFVNDENRVVTYKWLSHSLKVHVNQAKQMLYKFCEQQRNKKDNDISVTYFVAGSTATQNKDEQQYKCAVVGEEQLDSYKSCLDVVNTVHIYSIQKCNLKDSNALYIADFDGVKENILHSNQYSSIHCAWAKARSQDELKKMAGVVTVTHQENVKTKTSNGSSTNGGIVGAPRKKAKVEPKGSIASMFAGSKKTGSDNAAKPTEQQTQQQTTVSKNKKSKETKGGIAAMFSNVPKTTAAKPVQAVHSKTEDQDKKEKPKVEKEKFKKKSECEKTGRAKKKASSISDDESKPDRKRRRRIKDDLFDSSSEDEMECLEESPVPSPVIEISPEQEPESPIPDPVEERLKEEGGEQKNTGERKRRRTRKLVPKTYIDESGFMVTEKVWESDSTDVSEVEELPVKEIPKRESPEKAAAPTKKQAKGKKSPQKKSPPSGKTQASLTSFFKKN